MGVSSNILMREGNDAMGTEVIQSETPIKKIQHQIHTVFFPEKG